jgi:uncharacterized protein YukE
MSQAIADPDELRRLATNLKRSLADVQASVAAMHGHVLGVGDSWRDQEYDRFKQDFEQLAHMVERFLDTGGEYIPFLLRKAERIEEYLSQR